MIVQFNTTTLNLVQAIAGSDSTTLAYLLANIPGTDSAQIIADSSDVLNNVANINLFLAVVTGPTLTAVVRKKIITLTSSANPINLGDVPIITVQLKQSDGVTNDGEAIAVTFATTLGTMSNAIITTNGSGTALATFKPSKGGVSTIVCTAPFFVTGRIGITINVPSTTAQQNWLEENDIKDTAVSSGKLDPGFKAKNLNVPAWWHIVASNIRSTFNIGLDSTINSIVIDDNGFGYANGFSGGNATLKRFDKHSGTVTHTLNYSATGNNLNAGNDSMAFDGQNIWLPAGTKVLQIRASDLTIQNTVTGFTFAQSCLWDGQVVWVWDRANSAGAGLCKISGAIRTQVAGSMFGGAAGNNNNAFLTADRINIYISHINLGSAFGAKIGFTPFGMFGAPPAHGGVFYSSGGTVDFVSAADGKSLWVGGDGGIMRVDVIDPNVINLSLYSAANAVANTTGQIFDLLYTGDTNAVWATTSANAAGVTGKFLRQFVQSGTTIVINQQIDLVTLASMVNPSPIVFDGDNIYVGDFGTSTTNIVKVFVGK